MKKNLIVLQDGYKECGAASLLSIIRYYGGSIPISRLVEMTHTDKEGTNFYQLKCAGENLGFDVIGYQLEDFSYLNKIDVPFIIQIIDSHYEHFCVVYQIQKKKIIVMDPAVGAREILMNDFIQNWTGYLLIFKPNKKIEHYHEEKYLYEILRQMFLKNKGIIFIILLLSVFYTVFSCMVGFYFQFIMDFEFVSTYHILVIFTFFFGIIALLKCITNFFRNQVFIFFHQKVDCVVFLSTFKKILLLPYHYYHNKTTGEIMSRLNDLIYVKNFIYQFILTVCLDGILLFGAGFLLAIINFSMFLLIMMIVFIYLIIFFLFKNIVKRYTRINQINNAQFQSFLVETIGGIETIKNMNIESTMNHQMEKIYLKLLHDDFIYQNVGNLEIFMKELVSGIGILLFEFLGFSMVLRERMSVGCFMSCVILANSFLEPITNLLALHREYFYFENSLRRINHLFEVKEEKLGRRTNFEISGKLSFCDLSFSYNQERKILDSVNFEIPLGSKVIILGDSGSGKSTILKLLLRFYEVGFGMIYLDDVDINYYSISDLRESIGFLSQNEILYTDTILNNIKLYQDVEDKKWLEIAKLVFVDEFVKEMFLGYETRLEENGCNLSGGQRQRILLARLLLQNKKIILIDEGLNAIDVSLERKILENLFDKYPKKTIIIVSHRKENLDLFNQILYFKGKNLFSVKKDEVDL